MNKILSQQLANLSAKPGVYQFYNKRGQLLYVGKAKSLKNRVSSYFKLSTQLSPAKQQMVKIIAKLKTTIVDNDTEALLLESQLIHQYQPPYNIIFKDDKNWLYLAIDYKETYPRVVLTRQLGIKGIKYFGPYTSASAIRESFRLLKKILAFRTCKNPPEKPCFDSILGRCLGHNFTSQSKKIYQQQLAKLISFLKGHTESVHQKIIRDMLQAARNKKFEQATKLRDQLKLFERLLIKQKIISLTKDSFDVIGLAQQNNITSISRLLIRQGNLLDTEYFILENRHVLSISELLTEFIERYYQQVTNKPKTVIIPFKIKIVDLPIKISVTQRGYKKQLQNLAQKNAQNYLLNSFTSWQKRNNQVKKGLVELQKILKLPAPPQRIEGYDVSNIQGQNAVGSMVVMTNGILDKKEYRKFTIKKTCSPNDVAMLKEILERRFTKNNTWPKPDLIMLDGGKPQLNTGFSILQKRKIPLLALAKRKEEIFVPQRKRAIKLQFDSPVLQLLQRLRDETHRFGITFYRQKHQSATTSSIWQELVGIGPKLRTKLKMKFGTIYNLQQAKTKDLIKILGQNRTNKLLAYLKNKLI